MTDQDKQAEDITVRRADAAVLRITIGATLAALTLSFRNQVDFATQRGGYPVWGSILWALIIDSPVIVGELRLYSAAARNEGWRIKAWAWTITLVGLVVSMSAGAAHVVVPGWLPVKVLAAVIPPLMAAASLGTGLGIVKLNAGRKPGQSRQGTATRPPLPDEASTARARQPGKPRKRKTGQPDPETIAGWLADDKLAGLPTGRLAFWHRHEDEGLTEHLARVAVKAADNGGQLAGVPRS